MYHIHSYKAPNLLYKPVIPQFRGGAIRVRYITAIIVVLYLIEVIFWGQEMRQGEHYRSERRYQHPSPYQPRLMQVLAGDSDHDQRYHRCQIEATPDNAGFGAA